jgi:hypothetical protein
MKERETGTPGLGEGRGAAGGREGEGGTGGGGVHRGAACVGWRGAGWQEKWAWQEEEGEGNYT